MALIDDEPTEEQDVKSILRSNPEHQHSTGDIKKLIYRLRSGNIEFTETIEIIEALCTQWKLDKLEYILDLQQYAEEVYETTTEVVLVDRIPEYIATTKGYFGYNDLDRELKIESAKDKAHRRQILYRLVQRGLIEPHPTKNGYYRRVEAEADTIQWEKADVSNIYPITYPFGIENYALLYPKNIGVIAGTPNSGKTAFLLNLVKMNMDKHKIHYFCSEMGAEELKVRLRAFDDVPEDKWKFDARERSMNFADVIYPNDLNIIDYIEMPEGNFYMIASEIRAIFDRLRKGIAFIAIQKKTGADYGRGGDLSAEKARLYLTIENNMLKIKKGKVWAVEGQNPNGMEFPFKLIGGAKFIEGK